MENVHPLFQGILHSHLPKVELSEQDKANALRMALDPGKEMPSWLRSQIIGRYGTAEDLVKFAEKLLN